jgi:hypothetical protein
MVWFSLSVSTADGMLRVGSQGFICEGLIYELVSGGDPICDEAAKDGHPTDGETKAGPPASRKDDNKEAGG